MMQSLEGLQLSCMVREERHKVVQGLDPLPQRLGPHPDHLLAVALAPVAMVHHREPVRARLQHPVHHRLVLLDASIRSS